MVQSDSKIKNYTDKRNPFKFRVTGEQVIDILENFPDASKIKRGIDCGPFIKGVLVDNKKECTLQEAKDNILDYSDGKELSNHILGEYILYWDKKREQYSHEITLSGAREIDFYLEFGTRSSQKSLEDVFRRIYIISFSLNFSRYIINGIKLSVICFLVISFSSLSL